MTATKRKRGRPKKNPDAPAPASRVLPPVSFVETEPAALEDALASLDTATRVASSGDGAGVDPSPATGRADATAPSPDRTREPAPSPAPELEVDRAAFLRPERGTSPTNGKHPPSSSEKPRERSITGKAYAGLDRKQLRTALAIAENQNDAMRAQLREIVPAAAAAKVVALEKMTGVVISALFDLAALATKVDEVRLDRDEERELGELGAPAIAPYLGEYAQHAPLIAFGAQLLTVITTKVIVVKAIRDKQRTSDDGQ